MDWKALLDIITSLFKKIDSLKFCLSIVFSIVAFVCLESQDALELDYINFSVKTDKLISFLLSICVFCIVYHIIMHPLAILFECCRRKIKVYQRNRSWDKSSSEEKEFIKKRFIKNNKRTADIRYVNNHKEIIYSLKEKNILCSDDSNEESTSIIIKKEAYLYFSKKFKPSIFSRIKSFISNGCCSKDKK